MNDTNDRKKRATGLVDGYRMVVVWLVCTIASFGNAHAQSTDGWNHVRQGGTSKVVTLDRQSTVSVDERVWTALRSICPGSYCYAKFYWEDEYLAKIGLPEREMAKDAILVYSTNSGFKWNCAFRPFADNCFTKKGS